MSVCWMADESGRVGLELGALRPADSWGARRWEMTADRLARLLAGELTPASDEDRGALVLVALNYQALRRYEDRERFEQAKRVTEELRAWKAAA